MTVWIIAYVCGTHREDVAGCKDPRTATSLAMEWTMTRTNGRGEYVAFTTHVEV